MSGNRRRSRERALQALYQIDLAAADPLEALHIAASAEEGPSATDPEVGAFATELVQGVTAHLAELDELIQKYSLNWRVERMSRIDRNVVRLAAFELRYQPETPGRVILNEAIDLGKRYGSDESSAFVNGILDKVAQELGRR